MTQWVPKRDLVEVPGKKGSLGVPLYHHFWNSILISLYMKCIDLSLKELSLLSEERWTTHAHHGSPFWSSYSDCFFHHFLISKPVPEVSTCPLGICFPDILRKHTILTAWASGLGAGPSRSPEKVQEVKGKPGHPSLSCSVHVSS